MAQSISAQALRSLRTWLYPGVLSHHHHDGLMVDAFGNLPPVDGVGWPGPHGSACDGSHVIIAHV